MKKIFLLCALLMGLSRAAAAQVSVLSGDMLELTSRCTTTPNSVVTGVIGDLLMCDDGSWWKKVSGTGTTGWTKLFGNGEALTATTIGASGAVTLSSTLDVSGVSTFNANAFAVGGAFINATNNQFFQGRTTGGPYVPLIGINSSNVTVVGDSSHATVLNGSTTTFGGWGGTVANDSGSLKFSIPDNTSLELNSAYTTGPGVLDLWNVQVLLHDNSADGTSGILYSEVGFGAWETLVGTSNVPSEFATLGWTTVSAILLGEPGTSPPVVTRAKALFQQDVAFDSVPPTYVPYIGVGGLLTGSSTFYFGSGILDVPSLRDAALTSGRLVVASTSGLLSNNAAMTNGQVAVACTGGVCGDTDLTFATDTLTATKGVFPTSAMTPLLGTTSGDLTITPAGNFVKLTNGKQLIDSGGYASGWAGSGYVLEQNHLYASQSFEELDRLSVRGTMNVYELLVHQIRATNGSIFVSNTGKAKNVTGPVTGVYTIETETAHGFAVDDLIRSQRFTGNGVSQVNMQVVGVSDTTHFTATLTSGDTPQGGSANQAPSEFVRLGSTSQANRQGSIYMTADDTGAPFIDILSGVDSFAHWNDSSKNKCRIGKLDGITGGTEEFGIECGFLSGTQYVRMSPAVGIEIAGADLSIYNGGQKTFYVNHTVPSLALATSTAALPTGCTGSFNGAFLGATTATYEFCVGDSSGGYLKYVAGSLAVSGDVSVGANLNVSTNGIIRSGATNYGTGTGWVMDYNGGTPRARIGTVSGNRIAYDGADLTVVSNNVTIDPTNGLGIVGGNTTPHFLHFDGITGSGSTTLQAYRDTGTATRNGVFSNITTDGDDAQTIMTARRTQSGNIREALFAGHVGTGSSDVYASISASDDAASYSSVNAYADGSVDIKSAATTKLTVTASAVTVNTTLDVLGRAVIATGVDASPYTQSRLIVYGGPGIDTNNWAYFGYGADTALRVVYGKSGGGGTIQFGSSSATDNTGTFTPTATLDLTGNFATGGYVAPSTYLQTGTYVQSGSYVASGSFIQAGTGYVERQGTGGSPGAHLFNFNWNGSSPASLSAVMEQYVDNTYIGSAVNAGPDGHAVNLIWDGTDMVLYVDGVYIGPLCMSGKQASGSTTCAAH